MFVPDVTNRLLLLDPNYIVDVFRSLRSLKSYHFFGEWFWFKFNNLGLALDMVLKFYTSVVKRLKLKVKKLWGLIPTIVEVTGEKLVGCLFASTHPSHPPSWLIWLNFTLFQFIT